MRQRHLILSGGLLAMFLTVGAAADASFTGPLNNGRKIASTVPQNGDQNPYGVAIIPRTTGKLVAGHVLVSNFNNNGLNGGEQGTGTTIVQIAPNGTSRCSPRSARRCPAAALAALA